MSVTSGLPTDFNPSNYDAIVVGAGFAGAVCARRLAEGCNYRIAVLERRGHIAVKLHRHVIFSCGADVGLYCSI